MSSAIQPLEALTSSLTISTKEASKLVGKLSDQKGRQSLATLNQRVRAMLRPGNRGLDSFFYNVRPKDEAQLAARESAPQGSIVVVMPDPDQPLVFFPDVVGFMSDKIHKDVGAISVAGLGSSSVGAVGFARDVATATGLPVAAIASGYGLDDLMFEAVGGAFTLPLVNMTEWWFEQMRHSFAAIGFVPGLLANIEDLDAAGAGPDLGAAKSLMRPKRLPNLQWVVGHSKGNLALAGALAELACEDTDYRLPGVNIVLLSALTALPPHVGHPHQFIGSLDAFGKLNSRLNIKHKEVPGAMHHLNTKLPYALNAVEQIRSIIH
ncbi:MAG: hypothetical protein WBW33_17310 [Bryobacteraceae bacterium]